MAGRFFYVVRCDFARPDLLGDWDRWYLGHIDLLLGVPGFLSAQRFFARESPDGRPYLAVYEVSGPDVMTSAAYERARGFGGWGGHVRNWTRDLVGGAGSAVTEYATPTGSSLWAAFVSGSRPPGTAPSIGLDRSFDASAWSVLKEGAPPPSARWQGASAVVAALYEPKTEFARVDSARSPG